MSWKEVEPCSNGNWQLWKVFELDCDKRGQGHFCRVLGLYVYIEVYTNTQQKRFSALVLTISYTKRDHTYSQIGMLGRRNFNDVTIALPKRTELWKLSMFFSQIQTVLASCGFLRMLLRLPFCEVRGLCQKDQLVGENWSEVVSFTIVMAQCHWKEMMCGGRVLLPHLNLTICVPGVTEKVI